MSEILEIVMIVSFGASWPLNVLKSYRARTTKGKSLPFLVLIFCGYIAGIASKFLNETYTMVGIDLALDCRNYRLDKMADKAA